MPGNYHPLTPYSIQPGDWIAWQSDRPDLGGGAVEAFRRESNDAATQLFRLKELRPGARCEIVNLDASTPITMMGRQLMEQGMRVDIKTRPGSAVLLYLKLK